MRPCVLCLLAVVLCAGESSLAGIDGLVLPVSAPRSGRPMLVELRLTSRLGAHEGQAVVVLREGGDEAARWEGPVWRVGTEPTAFRVLLPPARDWQGHDDLYAELQWLEDGVAWPLARQQLARAGQETRAVAELVPPGIELPRDLVMAQAPPKDDDETPPRVTVAQLDPAEAATAAEAWLAWDAVLLYPQASLPEPLRMALLDWLLAGGRLVLPPGRPGPEVAALLAAAETADCGRRSGEGWSMLRAGLGLVVRAEGAPAETVSAVLWGAARGAGGEVNRHYRPEPDLSALLWPEAVGRVPLALVLTVFVGFLLWVGPVEWLVLGRLRRRRWTWVTFPLAAIIATWAVTAIARGAFGSSDHVRRLVIVDCDLAGTPRQTTTFEQRFAGGDRALVEQPRGELVLPLQTSGDRYSGDGSPIRIEAVHRGPWHAGGEVRIGLPQWTPVLLRRWRLGAPGDGPRADLGPAPYPGDAAAGLGGLRHDGWAYAALTGDNEMVGDHAVFAIPGNVVHRQRYGGDSWHNLRTQMLGAALSGQLGDLARGDCRLVARRAGADIIVWRQPLRPPGDPAPEVERKAP